MVMDLVEVLKEAEEELVVMDLVEDVREVEEKGGVVDMVEEEEVVLKDLEEVVFWVALKEGMVE